MRRAVLLVLALAACEPELANATPEGAVRELVERLRVYDGKDAEAEVLFARLSERAQAALRARADRYGAASGKPISPAAMLVPGACLAPTRGKGCARGQLRFEPQTYTAQIVGKYALVQVAGDRADQRAQIPCVFEEGVWRVDLNLPELVPLPRRPKQDQ